MVDYNPETKLYHVKRVHIPQHILEGNSKKPSNKLESSSSSSNSSSGSEPEEKGGGEGQSASERDGTEVAPQAKGTKQQVCKCACVSTV